MLALVALIAVMFVGGKLVRALFGLGIRLLVLAAVVGLVVMAFHRVKNAFTGGRDGRSHR